MKVYFLSSRPCALTLNGVFFGITDSFERPVEVCPSDKVYAKFSPEGALPIGFFITEHLLDAPPEGCEIYRLRDGIAVYAKSFPPCDFTLHIIAQAREGDCLATVFLQGDLQLTVEGAFGFFCTPLPPSFQTCKLVFHEEYILLEGKDTFALYTRRCEQLLMERFIEYSLSNGTLNATLPLSERLGRRVKCEWALLDGECRLTHFNLIQPTQEEQPPADLIAYAFFESLLIGADFTPFLNDALIPDAERIRAFLGDFSAVTLTNEPTVCGLIRKKKEGLFTVDYFSVEIENNKIIDVKG
jgi:hypothetical protein